MAIGEKRADEITADLTSRGVIGEQKEVTVKELDELSKAIFQQRAVIEEKEAVVKEANKVLQQLEMKMAAHLKELDRDNYKSAYGIISRSERVSYRMPQTDEDRAAFFQYLKDIGAYERMVSVNSQTLNAFAKEQQRIADEEGHGFDFKIPGLGQPSVFETVIVKRAKEK